MSTMLLQRMSSTDDDERTYSKFYAVPFWPFAAHHSGPHSDIIPFSRFIIITTITVFFFFIIIIRNRPCLIRIHKKRRRTPT